MPNHRASAGQIRRASGRSNTAYLRQLVETGWSRQDLDNMAKSKEGKGALHLAAWQGSLGSIDYLVDELGCDINVIARGRYSYGKTPIFFATTRNRNTMVKHLLKKGANVKVVNNKGQSVLSVAGSHLTPETIALVREAEERQSDIEWSNYRKTHSDGEVYGDLDPRFLERPIRSTDNVTDIAVNPTTRKSRLKSYAKIHPDKARKKARARNAAQKKKGGDKRPKQPSAELLIKYERVWDQLCGVLRGADVSASVVEGVDVNLKATPAAKIKMAIEGASEAQRERKISIVEYGAGVNDDSIASIIETHSTEQNTHTSDIVAQSVAPEIVASMSIIECDMVDTTLSVKGLKKDMLDETHTAVGCVSVDSSVSDTELSDSDGDSIDLTDSTNSESDGSDNLPKTAPLTRKGLYSLASQFGNLDIDVELRPVGLDTALISAAVPLFVQIVQLEDAMRRQWIPTATARLQGASYGVLMLDTAIAHLEQGDSDGGLQVNVAKPRMCRKAMKCAKVYQAMKERSEIVEKTVSELKDSTGPAAKVRVECRPRDLVLLKKWQQYVYKEHESDSTSSQSPQLTRRQRLQQKQSLDEFNTVSDWKYAREALRGLSTDLISDSGKSDTVLTLPTPSRFVDASAGLAQLEERLCEYIRDSHERGGKTVVAFDTEWVGDGDDVGLATIQLAVGNLHTPEPSIESWIVDLLSEEIEDEAHSFLSWLFVHSGALLAGFAIGHDLDKLNLFLHGDEESDERLVAPIHTTKESSASETGSSNDCHDNSTNGTGCAEKQSSLLDLQATARIEGLKMGCVPGLKTCCQYYISDTLALDKSEQRSDWARRPLTAAQLEYAGLDAAVLLVLLAAMDRKVLDESDRKSS